jgi:uncharacterized protein
MDHKEIDKFVTALVKRCNPEKVILFGSRATGKATAGSDVDLLVIMDTKVKPIAEEVVIRKEIPRTFPLDLIVMKPGQLVRRLKLGDTFVRSVLSTGRVLYEKAHG